MSALSGFLVCVLLACVVPPGEPPPPRVPQHIVFHAYNENGDRLTWKQFRQTQANGKGEDGANDMLVDPSTLTVVDSWPLYSANGDPALDRPATATALTMAWPTPDGYSNLILDLPLSGTYVFNTLIARQALADLTAQTTARPAYRPSASFTSARSEAVNELSAADAAPTEAQEGSHATKSYDAAVHAQLLLLREYGTQYAVSHRASGVRPQWGFTFDSNNRSDADLASVADIVGGDVADGWVRIVFDRSESASDYADKVAAAHRAGLRVVGQILDSSELEAVDMAAWQRRVAEYVTTLSTIDQWEVGNEVNGNWLGSEVSAKISFAASYVKAHAAHATTLVTLYWQLGEDDAAHSMFTWAETNLSAETLSNVDTIGLSMYPEDHPMGAAFDRVMRTLHTAFPSQQLSITELGYWSADLGHTWWWGSQTDPAGVGRREVADLYTRAALGYPYSAGGAFWWYYLQEAYPKNALWSIFEKAHRDVAG